MNPLSTSTSNTPSKNGRAAFNAVLKALLIPEQSTAAEAQNACQACLWLTNLHPQVRYTTGGSEAILLGFVHDYFITNEEAPSISYLKHLAETTGEPDLITMMDDEISAKNLSQVEATDVPALFAAMIDEIKINRTIILLNNGIHIAKTDQEFDHRGGEKATDKGSDDSVRYVWEQVDEGVVGAPSGQVTHGSLNDNATRVAINYDQRKDPTSASGKVMHTGIAALDKIVHPRRGQLAGIIGYAKSGKTRMGRTWNYHSLCQGLNVLHLSYEQTFDEELEFYAIVHSNNTAIFEKKWALDIGAYHNGALTKSQENFMRYTLIPDIRDGKSLPGKLEIRQPTGDATWENAMVQVGLTHHQTPIDQLFIDSITALEVGDYNAREAHNNNIQKAKTLAMTFDNNRGLLVISPFQVNRDSYDKAGKNGGRYDPDACYMYSQIEKALDLGIYVYSDDKLAGESCVIMGTNIHRRGDNVAPFRAAVEHACGTFHDFRTEITE